LATEKPKGTHPSPTYWVDILFREFEGESDRACAILAATLLDTALEALLRARLVPNASTTDSLFGGPTAPLADFSSRIDMAFRLGLISPQFARDLHIVRRIRNDFAHNISGCTFEDASVRDRVLALSRSIGTTSCHESWLERVGATPKGHFELILSWMLWKLRSLISRTSAIPAADPEWGYQKDWSKPPGDKKEDKDSDADADGKT